jgi:hypothetical protein
MSQQSRNSGRDRKNEYEKRDAASSPDRNSRNERESRGDNDRERNDDFSQISGLNRYRLNDLYERSSI